MTWNNGKPLIANQKVALTLGVIMLVGGAVLLYDSYEGRGGSKPFWTKFLPGL